MTYQGIFSETESEINLVSGDWLDFIGVWWNILGDPGADSGGEGKSKRTEKYGMKKSKERREEHLGTMSYQTSCKRSQGRHCPQGLFSPFFTFLHAIFFRPFRLSLAPTICPWVSEDDDRGIEGAFSNEGFYLFSWVQKKRSTSSKRLVTETHLKLHWNCLISNHI